ncbi:MAG: insulinase family protein [Gemmatimonadetes bacterium]|nr:insulinase family protein [Gemmatimonadota bacterium]
MHATTPASLAQPGTLARKRFREIAYGNHPFARVFPTEEMLRGFTVARVREFHAGRSGAKRAHLYVSGVFNAAAVEKAVRDAFGS